MDVHGHAIMHAVIGDDGMPHQGREEASMARINKATVTDYYVIDKCMEPEEVLRAVEHKMEEGGASFYHLALTMHRNETYGCYEEAQGAVDCLAATCYGDQAVMFHDVDSLAPSATILNLRESLRVARAERRAFVRGCRGIVHSSGPAVCDHCHAEVAWSHVVDGDYRCPACGNDLLPASVRARISAYDVQVSSLRKHLREKEEEQVRLAPVKWLVRCSYHL